MWKQNRKIILFITCALVLLIGISIIMNLRNHSEEIIVWSRFEPTSADPIDYDLSIHHLTMRSVFASLVSDYKIGTIVPQVAKSWRSINNKTTWIVDIDTKWSFENGDFMSPEIVAKSLKRIIFLKTSQDSKSGLFEFLVDVTKVKNIESDFAGITTDDKTITFNFIKPMPDFLERISFGLYSIVHPLNYNKNGSWNKDSKINASGAYKISNWSKGFFELELRNNLYINSEPLKIKKIKFNFAKNLSKIIESDVMFREKMNPFANEKEWDFYSTSAENNITYVKVMKWSDKKSVFSNQEMRTKLRDSFYKAMELEGLKITKSFFPLSIKNVKEFSSFNEEALDFKGASFSSQPYFIDEELQAKGIKELGAYYKNSFQAFTKKINAKPNIVDYPSKAEEEEKVFDIQFLGTGITNEAPEEDIKFMFLSKQGIRLPDETGEIKILLESDKLDVQKINQLLWNQAIIWPIRHYSTGVWLKKNSNIDISELNISLHPIDFQFLKWKK